MIAGGGKKKLCVPSLFGKRGTFQLYIPSINRGQEDKHLLWAVVERRKQSSSVLRNSESIKLLP